MELNIYGFVTAASVENSKKVKLIQREYESERVNTNKSQKQPESQSRRSRRNR